MSKTYQNYPAAPTVLVSAVSAAVQLPSITDMRLCKDNSVVLEVYAGEGAPSITDSHLEDLGVYFGVNPGMVCVQPGDDSEHLFLEVWATCFDFSNFFESSAAPEGESPDFTSEHVVLVDGAPFSVLVHYDYFFDRYVAEVPGIPGHEIIVAGRDLDSALAAASEEIDLELESNVGLISSASLFQQEINESLFSENE